jgi:plastocyanin
LATAGSSAGGASGGQSVSVNKTDANQFQPAAITIPRGATVSWVNTGQVP